MRVKLDEEMTNERRRHREAVYEEGLGEIERLQPLFE